ncbi:hypothetical protein DBP22_14400 [Streptomyces sp. CS207]|nr:hypothetical protein DBP22_14400 [Streptomyces sp. CS207]
MHDQPGSRQGRVIRLFGKIRENWARSRARRRTHGDTAEEARSHNLFEAAAVYVAACAEDDQERIDEARGWVSPEALSFGVNELACRAVVALARESDRSPQDVARALLGLPAS